MNLINGDCIEVMKTLPDNSVDSIVTDPPYELGFMGKSWDNTGIANNISMWKEALRVLKPGGHLLSFGGTRTYHRMACAIEDAGFEIRDCIQWLYGQGFPKSFNLYKQIQKIYKGGNTTIEHNDKQNTEYNLRPLSESNLSETINTQDKQGEVLQSELSEQNSHETMQGEESEERTFGKEESSLEGGSNILQDKRELQRCEICKMSKEISCYVSKGWLYYGTQINNGEEIKEDFKENRSNTPHRPQSLKQQDRESYAICEQCRTQILRRYEGLGTALKPANEPIVLARKPLSEKNVALNVLKWGTGGINIDGCRVGNETIKQHISGDTSLMGGLSGKSEQGGYISQEHQGRFPANIILDEEAGEMLDEQSGISKSIPHRNKPSGGSTGVFGMGEEQAFSTLSDKGGASRFFYCAKTSKSERNAGCEDMEDKAMCEIDKMGGSKCSMKTGSGNERNVLKKNNHPTVKPTKLMRYLCKLITPKGGTILDPFTGSGSTGIGAIQEGFNFIGIEREEEYIKIAEERIKPYLNQKRLF